MYSPLNTVLTVAKYEPMGTTIMAKVKASSLTMTSLGIFVSVAMYEKKVGLHPLPRSRPAWWVHRKEVGPRLGTREEGQTHMGTAGAMLDFEPAAELPLSMSSLSRIVFSLEMIL